MYYLCSENKGLDQLFCTADLQLCFPLCKVLVFWCRDTFIIDTPLLFKGADKPCNKCTADLHLCFCIDKNMVFS